MASADAVSADFGEIDGTLAFVNRALSLAPRAAPREIHVTFPIALTDETLERFEPREWTL